MKTCKYCGKELQDTAKFCNYCGNRCGEAEPAGEPLAKAEPEEKQSEKEQPEEKQPEKRQSEKKRPERKQPETRQKKKSLLPVVIGAAVILAGVGAGCFFSAKNLGGSETQTSLKAVETTENYQFPEKETTVDLTARDHEPAARDLSAKWDKKLFYWLEDIGGEDDNHIAEMTLARMRLTRADNGEPIEYEVYSDPETGEIFKIVSIENKEDGGVELSDYYYRSGKPNFVFRRSDSVYTPTYATIDKIGERYYFADDQMVKWRWIYEPSVVKQWILEPEDTWYTQWAYSEISAAERTEYDEKELQVLNEAYHTYEAVTANRPVALIAGKVTDKAGEPLAGVEVGIGLVTDGGQESPKLKLVTDEDGCYAWAADGAAAEGQEYYLLFRKKGYAEIVAGASLQSEEDFCAEPDVTVLSEKSKSTGRVSFAARLIEEQQEDELMELAFSEDAKEPEAAPWAEAEVTVYAGKDCTFGEPAVTGETDGDGRFETELPDGYYTAVAEKDGFVPARLTFLCGGEEQEHLLYSTAFAGEGAPETGDVWTVMLTWEASGQEAPDLDSSLFTPEKKEQGDRNCINTVNRTDGKGAAFLRDGRGENTCELIRISAPGKGSYKYYVTNYTDLLAGENESERLAQSGAKVSVCRNGELVETFDVPQKAGTVWEVFELRNGSLVPVQEMYAGAEGKRWWTEDKRMSRISQDDMRPAWIQSDGERLYFSNPQDGGKLYYVKKDGTELTKLCDDELHTSAILLVDDWIYYTTGNENGDINGYEAVVRIKTDGSGRTVVADGFEASETDVPLIICGYADGMLYCFYQPYYTGGFTAIPVGGGERVAIGAGSNSIDNLVTVGNYVYYIEWDYYNAPDVYCLKRCRLDGSEQETIVENIPDDPRNLNIYKGWIYYRVEGEIRRMRMDGTGDTSLMTTDRWIADVRLVDDYCYYTLYQECNRMDPDGSDMITMPEGASDMIVLDGEVYMKNLNDEPVVCDANGENVRLLCDMAPLQRQKAFQAYLGFLDGYVPKEHQEGTAGVNYIPGVEFACVDIDEDGIPELFVRYGVYRDTLGDYYRYENGLKTVWQGESVEHGMVVNRDDREIVLLTGINFYAGITRYRYDGSLIEHKDYNWGGTPEYQAELREYEKEEEYYNGKPKPKFVKYSAESFHVNLKGEMETGWE